MSELPEGIPPAAEPAPRDSASGIVLRRAGDGALEVLLGLRSRRARFMPAHLSFPGGGVEAADRPRDPDAFARCASREVEEETGVRVHPGAWLAAGQRTTPPMFPVRFHTHFFVTELERTADIPTEPRSPEEIERLRMARPQVVLGEWERGECRIPPPVLPILRELAQAGNSTPVAERAARIGAVNALEQRAPRIEFAADLWMLPVLSETLPPATHTNVWMPGGRKFTIIDPGARDPAEIDRLIDVVQRRRALGQEPDSVVLTHHHRDHVAGCAEVARRLGLSVRAHPETLRILRRHQPADVETAPINDEDEIDLGGVSLLAQHTPGHAPGHLAFVVVGRDQLIAGDLLSGLSTILIDPSEGDMQAYMASLERARALGCRMLLPGHGPPLPGNALERLIEHRLERERKILTQLSPTGTDLTVIADAAYADVPQMPRALTERQALSHLLALERLGRARRSGPDARSWAPA